MRIVITGGAGFIGSNLALQLCNEHEIIAIDNLSTGRLENLKQAHNKKHIGFINELFFTMENSDLNIAQCGKFYN
jgi:nucleoside-diphosphate-sugar epimerase